MKNDNKKIEKQMHETLFRAKRGDNGKWVYGYHAESKNLNRNETEHLIIIIKSGNDYVYPVLPETVGRHTGYKDKNDKRIFEGDIIMYNNINLAVCSEVNLQQFKGNLQQIILIGNIYDNPELLNN